MSQSRSKGVPAGSEFVITGLALGAPRLRIPREEYDRVKFAKKSIMAVLTIEANFDLFLGNYAEFEKELLTLALNRMIYSDLTWSRVQFDIRSVNRRIANLLSAGRLYLDHLWHAGKVLERSCGPVVEKLKAKTSGQYDSKLGYRSMETLRNHVQHEALPIHSLSYPEALIRPVQEQAHFVHRVVPRLATQDLGNNPNFKMKILAELKAIGPEVPLTPLVREYVEGLSAIHETFRTLTEAAIPTWEASFKWAWSRYSEEFGCERLDVQVIALDASSNKVESEQIFHDLFNERSALARKNGALNNLARRFVSGECDLRER